MQTWDILLQTRLTEFHQMFYMTRSTTFFSSTVFVTSRLVYFLIRRESLLKVYFEGAKKEGCNYDENALCYICFSRKLIKIYRKAILMNFFWCLWSKSQWSIYLMVFFNPSMLVVTKGHKYLNKTGSLSLRLPKYVWPLLPPGIKVLKGALKIIMQ